MVELKDDTIAMIRANPQESVATADRRVEILKEERKNPMYPMGGPSETYIRAAEEVRDAVHQVAAGVDISEAPGTVYQTDEDSRSDPAA